MSINHHQSKSSWLQNAANHEAPACNPPGDESWETTGSSVGLSAAMALGAFFVGARAQLLATHDMPRPCCEFGKGNGSSVIWIPVKREWKWVQSYADLGLAKQLLKRSCLQFKTPPPMFVAAVDMLIPWTFSAHQLLYMWIWMVIMLSPLNLNGGFNVGSTSQLRLYSYSFIPCCISSHGKSHEPQCLLADFLEFSSI